MILINGNNEFDDHKLVTGIPGCPLTFYYL